MASEEHLRRELIRVSHAVHARGWVANHDGNVTAQLAPGRFLSTPTAVSKGDVSGEMLIVVDGAGQVLQGTRKAFSELKLHLTAYRSRGDVRAVLHAHPPTATGFAVAGIPLRGPFMAEPIVSLGSEVPLIPFALPGDPALDANLAGALGAADVVMLGGHGLIAVGPDLDTCLLRMELVEHLCKIALVARQLGGARVLPEETIQALQAKHDTLFHRENRQAGAQLPTASERSPGASDFSRGEAGLLVQAALNKLGG
jgi:L-fuculose-phosphate aldolase